MVLANSQTRPTALMGVRCLQRRPRTVGHPSSIPLGALQRARMLDAPIRRPRCSVSVRAGDGNRPPDYWWLQPEQQGQPASPGPDKSGEEQPAGVAPPSSEGSSSPISIWDTKPFWCQPWSILFTGAGGIGMSWDLLHWPWLTATIAGVIVVWWLLFLVVNPRLFDEYVQEAEREGRDWMLEMDLGPELSEKIRAKKQAAAGR